MADGDRCDDIKGLGQDALTQQRCGQGCVLQLDALQIHAAQRQMRQVQLTQIPAQQPQQRHQVGRAIPLGLLGPSAQPIQQRAQLPLHLGSRMSHALQAFEQRSQQQPLLRLPHIVLGPCLREAMLTEPEQPPLPDLLAGRGDQPAGHILQHHRVQGEAASMLPPLDERAPAQAIHGFQHLDVREWCHQHRAQVIEGHRLAQDRQPEQHRLLQRREPRPLLVEQLGDAAKHHRTPGEERVDLAPEEVDDGLGHDV